MNQPSQFQAQYPLSPKKFWKKIFFNLFTYFIFSIFLGFIGGAIVYMILAGNSALAYMGYAFLSTLISYIVLISLNAWYIRVYIRRYYYDCGDQFVTIQKGVFAPTEIHVQYQKIQDVYVDQDFLDRLLGLYDVHIASATVTSGIEAHIDGVDQAVAESIKNLLLAKIQGGNVSVNIPTSGQSGAVNQSPVTPPKAPSFNSATKVSSDTFPISGAWTFSAIMGAFLYSISLTLILGSILSGLVSDISSSAKNSTDSSSILGYAFFLFLIILFGRIIWVFIWKSNYYFEFLPDYILLRTGVISRSEIHLPYKSIQNVTKQQGVIDRMLGIATVLVENAAFAGASQQSFSINRAGIGRSSGISIIGQPPERAEQLNQILNQIVSTQVNVSASMGV